MNLVAALDRAARATPDKPFLVSESATITYAAARERSHRAAAVLSALGIAAGDRVAAMCFNTPAFVDLMFGAWRLGATFVPVNHKLQAPEVDYVLEHSRSKALLFDVALAPVVERIVHPARRLVTEGELDGVPCFDTMCATMDGVAGIEPADGDIAQILYTSGTTGRPKGCVHSHRTVTLAAMSAALATGIGRNERTLMAMPIWHSSPLNNWFGGTLVAGGTVVLLREYHPLRFLQTVERERVTLYFGAPVSYTLPIGAAQAERLARAYRSDAFFHVYGMTETGPAGTTLYPDEQIAKAGSIGRHGGPGVDLRVVRMDGIDAQPGETGEIWLKADSMMLGYLDDAAATRAAFALGGWYRTGDVARIDQDGYLFIVDRLKDMIVTGGENVYSKEVEDVLGAHPDIAEAAVVGVPHPDWGETVVAHVVMRAGTAPDADALRAFCGERLAAYKIPREFAFAQALPRTPTGKLQKFLLRVRKE
ncbi:AMP-binding protein [Burkholderia sp. RS02]|uniref:class I adenylate-forming enzyme family protein n=1 Tax=unclassified Burkholderia TaxID=2613784 RepID=UPI0032185A70